MEIDQILQVLLRNMILKMDIYYIYIEKISQLLVVILRL